MVNQATPRIQELYGTLGYDLRFLDAPRSISCDGDRPPRRSSPPVMYDAAQHQHPRGLRGDDLARPRARRVRRRETTNDRDTLWRGRSQGRRHHTRGDERILVSLKWQQTGGTAEQKVPFEVMCLADAVTAGHAVRAFLALGGDGWKSATTSRPVSFPST